MRYIIILYLIGSINLLEAHGHHEHHEHDEFLWTQEKSEYADIQLELAGPGFIQKFTQVSGRIIAHPDHLSYMIPKVKGTVCSIEKNLGDLVEKGDVLAIVESHEVAEAKAHYLRALNRAITQQKFLKREETLRGISAERDYLEAKLASDEAAIEYECALQDLYFLGFSEEEIVLIREEDPEKRRFYSLKSPMKGKILERNLTLGECTDDEVKAFTVGNFEKVWVEMHIPQDEIHHLKEGLEVGIASTLGKKAAVRVCQFSPAISEETRMARAIAVMENPSESWRPGQYVNASILIKTTEFPLVVPREAVQKIKGETYVFVQCEDNFEPCRVRLGKMDEMNVEIVSGLHMGDCYVSSNAFCLKADYEKEEVEHNH